MKDPRETPSYTVTEASHYLRVPVTTLRAWFMGMPFPAHTSRRPFRRLFVPADPHGPLLSFVNLLEAHVLDAIRHDYKIPVQKVRRALDFLHRRYGTTHPLVTQGFETDGVALFVKELERDGRLVSATEGGQQALREVLKHHLRRIERDRKGLPIRLYPFTRHRESDEPRTVMIDPMIAFGRPVLVGTGIPTTEVAQRHKAGETIAEIAKDYGRKPGEIEEAIRCELRSAQAA